MCVLMSFHEYNNLIRKSTTNCFLFLYPASAIMHAIIITISKTIAFNNIIIGHSSTWSMLIKVMGKSNILS